MGSLGSGRRVGGVAVEVEGLGRGDGQSSFFQLDLEPRSGTARLLLNHPPPALSLNGRLFLLKTPDPHQTNPHAPALPLADNNTHITV